MTHSDPDIGKPVFSANLGDKYAHFRYIFTQIGLEPERVFSRLKCSGEINGRYVSITVAPRTRNRYLTGEISYRRYLGMMMSIEVKSNVQTRLLLSKEASRQAGIVKMGQSRMGNERATELEESYPGYMVWAKEPEWATAVFGQTAVRQAWHKALYDEKQAFMDDKPTNVIGSTFQINADGGLIFSPAAIPDNFSRESLETILNAIFALAAAGEAYPPQIPVKMTWLEKQPTQNRVYILTFGFLFGIPLLLFLFCMLPAFILILMFGI